MSLALAVCPKCRDWVPGETDRFCGGCGAFIAPVRFEWMVQGKGSSVRLALKASVSSDWSEQDRADFAELRLAISNEAQDQARRGSTVDLAKLMGATGAPLMDETRAMRGGAPQVLVLRALAGRAGRGDTYAGDGLIALVDSSPPPALGLAQGEMSIPDLLTGDPPAVRLINEGGPFAVHGVRLVLDKVFEPNVGFNMLPSPLVLEEGDSALAPLKLSDTQLSALKRPEHLHEGDIEVIDGLGVVTTVGRLTLITPLDPDARVEVAAHGMALQGRRARLAVRLVNSGGHPLVVEDIEVQLAHGKSSAGVTLPTPSCWRSPLDRGDEVDVELRPWMTRDGTEAGAALAPALYNLTIKLRCRAGDAVFERTSEGTLRVKAPEPLKARLCIDFGTTESAAALALGAKPGRLDEGQSLPPPLIIELGRVGVPTDGGHGFGDRFLPTVVFRGGDGRLAFGDDALAQEVDPRHGDELLSNFKWRLEDEDGALAATQYLAHVRTLIEEHPLVAALITPETEVYATRPVDFAEGQAESLAKSFRDAGFKEPRTNIFARREDPTLIYESWSPMIMALFRDPAIFTPLDREVIASEAFVLPGQEGQTGYVAIFDIGGGSADLSVLKVDEEPNVRRVLEVYKRTDLEFVGLKFAALIRKELHAWVRERDAVPSDAPADEAIWQEAVRAIQHNPGLLSDGSFETPMRDFFRVCVDGGDGLHDFIRSLSGRLGVPFEGERTGDITEAQAALRSRLMPDLRKLRLPLAGGGRRAVTIADLPQLLGRVASAFAATYVRRVADLTADLVNTSGLHVLRDAPEPDSAQLARLIQSGRGASFPMADNLVFTLFGPLREKRLQAQRLPALSAKSITSYGGLYLADYAAMEWDIRFNLGREIRRFWLRTGFSTRRMAPVRVAMQRHEDGTSTLNCAEIAEDFRYGPWQVEASWEGSNRFDDLPDLPAPPGLADAPGDFWLVARRRNNIDRVACVKAASAAEAATQLQTESIA